MICFLLNADVTSPTLYRPKKKNAQVNTVVVVHGLLVIQENGATDDPVSIDCIRDYPK